MVEKATWVTERTAWTRTTVMMLLSDRLYTSLGFVPMVRIKVKHSFPINKKAGMGQKVILRYL